VASSCVGVETSAEREWMSMYGLNGSGFWRPGGMDAVVMKSAQSYECSFRRRDDVVEESSVRTLGVMAHFVKTETGIWWR